MAEYLCTAGSVSELSPVRLETVILLDLSLLVPESRTTSNTPRRNISLNVGVNGGIL